MAQENSVIACPLCEGGPEEIVWSDELCRVIRVEDDAYPGFCRVIWQEHVAEMTDLSPTDRHHLFTVVMAVEKALRRLMNPDKINLASLGNMVPHLHWHVIPRFSDDRHFPEAIWSAAQRPLTVREAPDSKELTREIAASLGDAI